MRAFFVLTYWQHCAFFMLCYRTQKSFMDSCFVCHFTWGIQPAILLWKSHSSSWCFPSLCNTWSYSGVHQIFLWSFRSIDKNDLDSASTPELDCEILHGDHCPCIDSWGAPTTVFFLPIQIHFQAHPPEKTQKAAKRSEAHSFTIYECKICGHTSFWAK